MPLEEREGFTSWHIWLLTLTGAERGEADHIVHNLDGNFADAYLAVKMLRLEQRSALRVGLRELITIGSSVLAALGVTRLPHVS